ncbi:hypothetical protein [Diadegma fenestrale ichnovirus]|nr:hypothetical protein [Diadegma fenestrale ichnovirus]
MHGLWYGMVFGLGWLRSAPSGRRIIRPRSGAWSNYQHARHQSCKVLNLQIWLHVGTFCRMHYMDGEHYFVDLNVCWNLLQPF